MRLQPVKKYISPKYPDKATVRFNPNLLKKLPDRWKGNISVKVAMSSLIVMMLAACEQSLPSNFVNNGTIEAGPGGKSNNGEGERIYVAPLFVHGTGRGAFGCVSVAPPNFLSEEEAFQVVQEEAEKLGLEFSRDGHALKNIDIPVTDIFPSPSRKEDETKLLNTKAGELQLDGFDGNKSIGFEFISKDDFVSWHEQKNRWASVETYDLIPAAETLRSSLEEKTEGSTVGIFYDPMVFSEEINNKYSEKSIEIYENQQLSDEQKREEWQKLNESYKAELKQLAEDELREQVKDFINWLKAEGII
jgi:hypothetical protein